MKSDIRNREDILQLVRTFYEKMLVDEQLRPIFVDIAQIDLEAHLPLLADFWEQVLFQRGMYKRNVMQIHLDLNQQHALKKEHFDLWLHYFNETMDEMFEGEKAFLAKTRAQGIATMMQVKIWRSSIQ